MNKKTLFYRTRRASFLWKSALVLAVGMIALGTAVSLLNKSRLDAYQHALVSPQLVHELAEEMISGENSGQLTAAILEELASDLPFHEKLEDLRFLLSFAPEGEDLIFPAKEILSNLSEDEFEIASAFVGAILLPIADEAFERLIEQASSETPAPNANYALALAYESRSNDTDAIAALKREILISNSDPARQRLVNSCLDAKNFEVLEQLQNDPGFEPLITHYVQHKIALSKMNWPVLLKTYFSSAYEGVHVSMVLLAILTGVIWSAILLRFSGSMSVRSFPVQLAIPALVLGALSAHGTILCIYWQEYQHSFSMGSETINQLFYCIFGIGLREELLKLLFFVPLIPFLLKRNDLEILTLAGLVGLGFATAENINYFESSAGLSALGRFVTANFLHISLTALCGLTLTRAIIHRGKEIQLAAITFGMAVVAHGLYDAFIMVPALMDYSFLTYTVFVLISYQYFGWLRHLRDEWKDPFSITAVFTYGVILITGISFGLYAWNIGPLLAFQAVGYEVIGIGIILILFYREIPETIN